MYEEMLEREINVKASRARRPTGRGIEGRGRQASRENGDDYENPWKSALGRSDDAICEDPETEKHAGKLQNGQWQDRDEIVEKIKGNLEKKGKDKAADRRKKMATRRREKRSGPAKARSRLRERTEGHEQDQPGIGVGYRPPPFRRQHRGLST